AVPTPLSDLSRSLNTHTLRTVDTQNAKIENQATFDFGVSSVGIASGSRLDDLNAQVAKIHSIGMTFQADITLVGNPAQRPFLGKDKRRIVKVDFMNPITVQEHGQAAANARNLDLVPLAGLPAHSVERNHRAVNCPAAVEIGELPVIVEKSDFQPRERGITLLGGTQEDAADRVFGDAIIEAQGEVRIALVRAQPPALAFRPKNPVFRMPILRTH